MNNKLVFDDSHTFHTKIYCDVYNFIKNVLNHARNETCATTGTFTLNNLLKMPIAMLRLEEKEAVTSGIENQCKTT